MVIAEEVEGFAPAGWRRLPPTHDDSDSAIGLSDVPTEEKRDCNAVIRESEDVYLEPWNVPTVIPEIFQVWRA
jgi:hypothetical protein